VQDVSFFRQTPIGVELASLPVNTALLQLIGAGEVPAEYQQVPNLKSQDEQDYYAKSVHFIEQLALYLKPAQSSQLSRPMQRKLVTLINCQLLEEEGQARAARAARSLGERSVTELILQVDKQIYFTQYFRDYYKLVELISW
jgi:RING finger/CCCH-type zinc finger protein